MVTIDRESVSTPTLDETAVQAYQDVLRGQLIRSERPGLRDSTPSPQRNDRQASRPDRPLCRRCGRRRLGELRARTRPVARHSRWRPQRPRLGTCDGGLVIDLSCMRSVRVDPMARTARVEGGCTLGDVDHATHAYGLAVPLGVASTTGVGGLTLGGGMGHLTRPYGLSIDNLLEADMVLADGSIVTASAEQHPDLFWAIRGGGGNFGVVTSFLFRAHPVSTVYAGPMLWHIDQLEDVLRWYNEFQPSSSEHLNGTLMAMSVPPDPHFPEALHNLTMCAIVWCWSGPHRAGGGRSSPRFGRSSVRQRSTGLARCPSRCCRACSIRSSRPVFRPTGRLTSSTTWGTRYSRSIVRPPNASRSVRQSLAFIRSTVPRAASRRMQRRGAIATLGGQRCSPVLPKIRRKTTRSLAGPASPGKNLHPYAAGGGYVNMMMEEGGDRVRAAYRGNYARLAQIKATYDPGNLFRVNQNIKPSNSLPE